MKERTDLMKKLGAYALAAGAASVATTATTAQAVINYYESPTGPGEWYVETTGGWGQDMIMFKMDGTVVLNDTNLPGLGILGQDADSFTLTKEIIWWYGTDEKGGNMMTIGANVGFVDSGNDWDVGRLGGGYDVGATLADGRTWSDHATTSTGGLGGWNFYFHGEWPFGGGGTIGLYADDIDGRHYGWVSVNMGPTWYGMRINGFAFETTPGLAIIAGDTGPSFAPGDLDMDNDIDADDIDLMAEYIRTDIAPTAANYDLVADAAVDMLDMDLLVRSLVRTSAVDGLGAPIFGTEYGDFNLDGLINTTDLTLLATNFGPNFQWAMGNANTDVDITNTDLTIMATFFNFTNGGVDNIPEPITLSVLALGASGLLAHRRRK